MATMTINGKPYEGTEAQLNTIRFMMEQATKPPAPAPAPAPAPKGKGKGKGTVVTSEYALPKGIEDHGDAWHVVVPKATPTHVSASGKSLVMQVNHLLPKGTPNAVGFIGGKMFFPL